MSQGNDIDPRLQDVTKASNSEQQDLQRSKTSPPPVRFPRNSQQALQAVPSEQSPQYAPYGQDSGESYAHTHVAPSPGTQNGQSESAGDFHTSRITPGPNHPGPQYVSKASLDSKRLRACEACRGLKVRCEPDPVGGPCKRCLKSGRRCEVTVPSRKRQKKTDSRVSELEKQLADIQAQLKISGHIANDSEGQSYHARTREPHHEGLTRRPIFSQSPNERSSAVLDTHMFFRDPPSDGRRHSQSYLDRDGSFDDSILGSTQRPSPKPAILPSSLPVEAIVAEIRIVASSMDTQLAMILMDEYAKTMLPQKPEIGALLVDRMPFLQRSKPVLFLAIMTLMLQTRYKDTLEVRDPVREKEGSGKGNQALHLLSEVAMGNSAQNEDDQKERYGERMVEKQPRAAQNPANVLAQKLLDTRDVQVISESWFEELILTFH